MVRLTGDQAVGGGLLEVGAGYRWLVTECEEHEAKTGNTGFVVACECVGSEIEGQIGKTLQYQSFYNARLFKLCAALCLTNKATGKPFTPADNEALIAAIKAKQEVGEFEFDPAEAVGREFGSDVVMGQPRSTGKNAGKSFPELGMNIECVVGGSDADEAAFD
jgi:hypothetical protein